MGKLPLIVFSSVLAVAMCYRRWVNTARRALKKSSIRHRARSCVAGLLTGISYVSGIDYYKGINERVRARLPTGHLFSPNPSLVMVSVDCDEYAHHLINKDWSGVSNYLLAGKLYPAPERP